MNQEDQEFLQELFAYEYCECCGGDVEHHEVTRALFGLPFAFCQFAPNEDTGEQHPVVAEYREEVERNTP